jgi:hypothetical protein
MISNLVYLFIRKNLFKVFCGIFFACVASYFFSINDEIPGISYFSSKQVFSADKTIIVNMPQKAHDESPFGRPCVGEFCNSNIKNIKPDGLLPMRIHVQQAVNDINRGDYAAVITFSGLLQECMRESIFDKAFVSTSTETDKLSSCSFAEIADLNGEIDRALFASQKPTTALIENRAIWLFNKAMMHDTEIAFSAVKPLVEGEFVFDSVPIKQVSPKWLKLHEFVEANKQAVPELAKQFASLGEITEKPVKTR